MIFLIYVPYLYFYLFFFFSWTTKTYKHFIGEGHAFFMLPAQRLNAYQYTVFTRFNAPDVYSKLGLVDPASV